jgi:thiosulfate/3-mercaptopyruvate sulfurtransferase
MERREESSRRKGRQTKMIARLSLLLVLSSSLLAQIKPAHPEMLVSTSWLADHLHDKNLTIIEVGPKQSDYEQAHIPGARFLPTEKIAVERDGVKNQLPPTDDLIAALEGVGISNKSRIVIYASQYPTVATRLYWTLDYLGVAQKASLLDGGIAQWKAENRPTETGSVAVAKKGKIKPKINRTLLAEASDVQVAAKHGETLIDSRPPKRFTDGHIAGAVPLYWQQTVTKEPLAKFLDTDSIRQAYEAAGVKPGAKVVTYCDTGMQATHSYFTLKYLGYDVKMYDGSFSEWNDVKHLPVVTGDKPR